MSPRATDHAGAPSNDEEQPSPFFTSSSSSSAFLSTLPVDDFDSPHVVYLSPVSLTTCPIINTHGDSFEKIFDAITSSSSDNVAIRDSGWQPFSKSRCHHQPCKPTSIYFMGPHRWACTHGKHRTFGAGCGVTAQGRQGRAPDEPRSVIEVLGMTVGQAERRGRDVAAGQRALLGDSPALKRCRVIALVGTVSCGSDVAGSDAEECSLKKAREAAKEALLRSTFLGSV